MVDIENQQVAHSAVLVHWRRAGRPPEGTHAHLPGYGATLIGPTPDPSPFSRMERGDPSARIDAPAHDHAAEGSPSPCVRMGRGLGGGAYRRQRSTRLTVSMCAVLGNISTGCTIVKR